ncbi:MAG: metallophosphoesterase [Kiritimatiellae bacterium]|nr:metallophosphoesterase [Kiritimatiellia bacterium]
MNRRGFLASAALAAPAAFAETGHGASSAGKPLKVCVFADLHYHPGMWTNTEDTSFLEKIMARAERERCEMMIHLGDFMHGVRTEKQKALLKLYNDFRIPGYHILGNHDQDGNPYRETCDAYRMPDGHYTFDRGGFRFVIADPNYFRNGPDTFIHFDYGNHYRKEIRAAGSTVNWIPPEQMEWLRAVIIGSPLPCVVLSHQSLERGKRSPVMNRREVRAIFNEANAKRPGTVRLVMNGHTHTDHLRILDNILYWDVAGANYQYFEKKHDRYPAEYVKTHRGSPNSIGWKEPLSAILTLWPEGRIRIDGAKSDWLFGVSPEAAGYSAYDEDGRETLPVIQSADLTFAYS